MTWAATLLQTDETIAESLRKGASELILEAERLERRITPLRTAAMAQARAESLRERASALLLEAERLEAERLARLEAERRARTRPRFTTPPFLEETLALGALLDAHRALRLALSTRGLRDPDEPCAVGGNA